VDKVDAAIERIPVLAGMPRDAISVERLGGLTNLVYRLETPDGSFALRLAGDGTEEYIDRKVEGHNTKAAAAAGVGPEVLFFDQDDGLMLLRYLDGCATMTPDTFPKTPGAPARAAEVLKKMHDHPEPFEFRFELFSMIDEYLKVLDGLGASLPDGYHDVVKEAEAVRAKLDKHPAELAPCHCDPLCENFLDDGERMWIVDWEYSGMNDPLWDLGDLSVEAGFDANQDREMMQAYCGGKPSAALFGRMVIYKAMCDLLWTLWGLIQHANDNPVEDFWAYAVGRFERCKTLMADPSFADHLAAIERG
jgi:thiamine kinase-like enzyme